MNELPFEKIEREILIKKETKASEKYGQDPKNRSVEELLNFGIVNINKPKGPTSHQVSAYTQKILGINKGGHSGTLDPRVTGVLPVALGRATRIVQALLPAGKEYICMMHLHKPIAEGKIINLMKKYIGKIRQLPPIKSAVKRQYRNRRIYYLDIMEIQDQDVLFKVGCQAGTYIRVLCHSIGQDLGCGAHMAQLVRTKAGPFKERDMFTLQDLTDALHYYKEGNEKFIRKVIQPIEAAVEHLPRVWIHDSAIQSICHGSDLKVPGISKIETEVQIDEMIAIMSLKDELIALGELKMLPKEIIKEEKGLAIKVNKVFMKDDLYLKNS
jgi:H/ACA ribonucleoprotein complex subunit 4